jgi:hypothetical protein
MQVKRWMMVATIGAVLVLSGCKQDKVAEKYHPATLEESGQEGIMKVTLDARAAERIGLQTAAVREEMVGSAKRLVVPYGAIMYDAKGVTWTFTNPQPLVYVRHKIVVEDIVGDRVILLEGPPAGTVVVTVGASELMGAEHKYGH